MAAKRDRQQLVMDADVIDLCSPVPCKPCRKETPSIPQVQSSSSNVNVDIRPVALFSESVTEVVTYAVAQGSAVESEDEYWEPEEYRAITANAALLPLATNDLEASISDVVDQAKELEAIIDLCSPCNTQDEVCSDAEAVVQRSAVDPPVDLTQISYQYEEKQYEETTQYDTKLTSDTRDSRLDRLEEESQSSVSLFSHIAAAPRLHSRSAVVTTVSTRPQARPSASSALSAILRNAESQALRSSQTTSAIDLGDDEEQEDDENSSSNILPSAASVGGVARPVSSMAAGHRSTTLQSNIRKDPESAKRTASYTGSSSSAGAASTGAPGRSGTVPSISRKSSGTTTLRALVAAEAAAARSVSAPVESAFRSRFTAKSMVPLPALAAGESWEVMLLIDKRERSNAHIQSKMAANCIPCRLAVLAVGDFLWVVRPRGGSNSTALNTTGAGVGGGSSSSGNSGGSQLVRGVSATVLPSSIVTEEDEDTQASALLLEEEEDRSFDTSRVYVLDCVAERKSVSDLASSFHDGRYAEQKNRLKACGLRSTMYIVEGDPACVNQHQKAITTTHIKSTMVSIHVESGMHVLRTRSMDHTITSLQNLHRQIEQRFRRLHDPVRSTYQPFPEFQSMYAKRGAATHRQLFGHQLRQIHGVSTTIAVTLMDRYGTTARFMDELSSMGQAKAEYTLANTVNEVTRRKLGPKLAKKLWQIYMGEY